MARLGGGIDPNRIVMMLIVGVLFLFLITSIINFNAISGDEKCLGKTTSNGEEKNCLTYKTESTCVDKTGCIWAVPDIFNEDLDFEETATGFFKWLIVSMAAWLAWVIVITRAGGRFDKKGLITLVIIAVILFFIYNKVLVPQLGWQPIEFAAVQLQSIVTP